MSIDGVAGRFQRSGMGASRALGSAALVGRRSLPASIEVVRHQNRPVLKCTYEPQALDDQLADLGSPPLLSQPVLDSFCRLRTSRASEVAQFAQTHGPLGLFDRSVPRLNHPLDAIDRPENVGVEAPTPTEAGALDDGREGQAIAMASSDQEDSEKLSRSGATLFEPVASWVETQALATAALELAAHVRMRQPRLEEVEGDWTTLFPGASFGDRDATDPAAAIVRGRTNASMSGFTMLSARQGLLFFVNHWVRQAGLSLRLQEHPDQGIAVGFGVQDLFGRIALELLYSVGGTTPPGVPDHNRCDNCGRDRGERRRANPGSFATCGRAECVREGERQRKRRSRARQRSTR